MLVFLVPKLTQKDELILQFLYQDLQKLQIQLFLQQYQQLFPLLFFLSQPYPKDKLEEMITYPAQIDLWNHPRFHADYMYKTEETGMGFISYFERGDGDNG